MEPLRLRVLLALVACIALFLTGCPKPQGEVNKDPVGKKEDNPVEQPGPAPVAKTEDKKPDPPAPAKTGKTDGEPLYQGKAVSAWINPLKDKDWSVRSQGANALSKAFHNYPGKGGAAEEPPQALLQALAAALGEKDDTVRFVAAACLQRTGPRAVPFLAVGLKDQNPTVRREAAKILGATHSGHIAVLPREAVEPAVPALCEALMKDEVTEVRAAAADALTSVGKDSAPARSALGQALLKDKASEVRQGAAYGLARCGGFSELVTAIKSGDGMARTFAMRSILGHFSPGHRKLIPALIGVLEEEDIGMRCEAARALGSMRDEAGEALPALLIASKKEDEGGKAAREVLPMILKAPRSEAPALIALLKDPEPHVRLKAVTVLCDLEEGDKECLACLLELVKRRDSQVRLQASNLLFCYGSAAKDAVPALIEIVRNDFLAQGSAIKALGAIGPDAKPAIPAIKAVMLGHLDKEAAELAQAKMAEEKGDKNLAPVYKRQAGMAKSQADSLLTVIRKIDPDWKP